MNLVNLLGNVDAAVDTPILDVLDADLPADPYRREIFDPKVQALFDHAVTAYADGSSTIRRTRSRRPLRERVSPFGNRRR